jgi:hypothetical protein
MTPNLGMNFAQLLELASDPEIRSLTGVTEEKIKQFQARADIQGQERLRLAATCARVAQTADGSALLEYLIGQSFNRYENVTELTLPMETAIQLHASADGRKQIVWDLMRLIAEGMGNDQPQGTAKWNKDSKGPAAPASPAHKAKRSKARGNRAKAKPGK